MWYFLATKYYDCGQVASGANVVTPRFFYSFLLILGIFSAWLLPEVFTYIINNLTVNYNYNYKYLQVETPITITITITQKSVMISN